MTGRGMTLDMARRHIGNGVVYSPGYGQRESGVIVRVNDRYVFVRYQHDHTPRATRPSDLELAGPCPRCGGMNGSHGIVHVRHGNGGGHNEPCPVSAS